jgi:hypothetical protein
MRREREDPVVCAGSAKRVRDKPTQELIRRVARNTMRLREEQDLTLMELGRRAGLHWRHLQKIEAATSNVTLATIARLARGFSVEAAALIAKVR